MASPEDHTMSCMEVWGGNREASAAVSMTGLDAWVYSKPYGDSSTGGGDVHYVSSCASGSITRLLLADVSGHGNTVAEIAIGLRDLMREQVNRLSQDRVIKAINQKFSQFGDDGLFATALVFTYFAPREKLVLSNAGHPPPLIYRAADQRWSYIKKGPDSERLADLPLGVIEDMHFDQHTHHLKPGDMVLCYSDALIEAHGPGQRSIGADGLLEILSDVPFGEPREMIDALLDRIVSLCPHNLERDDVTVLLFRRDPKATKVNWPRLLASPVRMALAKFAKAAD